MTNIADQVVKWQAKYGRNKLPWQGKKDPYPIWVSEIMLQQTGVKTVIKYYENFLKRFPSTVSLGNSSLDDVLQQWSGLGLYRRARNMHLAAQDIIKFRNGIFPDTYEDLVSLPGIGRSTAGAILVFAYGKKYPILDGNVKRLFARYFCVEGEFRDSKILKKLWNLSELNVPENSVREYTQGLMDLGAGVCSPKRPNCKRCPLNATCKSLLYKKTSTVPVKTKKSAIPTRETFMLILIKNQKLMMEKRPIEGIWGGLLSFPEFISQEALNAYLISNLSFKIKTTHKLARLVHNFSHYRLVICPTIAKINVLSKYPRPLEGAVWLEFADAVGSAIPAPIRQLITKNLFPKTKP
ncbi:MAG: A/G-specific adenine glycosylase [Proteobacteria bacterium]|nr:A/G-specific adenine glycosylase [Pseudomonadota bacterium]